MNTESDPEPNASTSGSTLLPIVLVTLLGLSGAAVVATWGLVGMLSGESPVGDGRDPSSYGFDLSNVAVDPEAIIASGNPRDFLPALISPEAIAGAEVASLNASNKRKWQKEVVSGDRVVGVRIGDSARAYPMFILDAHEVVLDEVGGVPIVLARSPLVDEVGVYERSLGATPLDFGVSGLLDDLSVLLYTPDAEGMLVSGHDGRVIAGPRIGERLVPVSEVVISTWQDWLARHPETDVVLRDLDSLRRYRRVSYDRYLDGDDWILSPRRTPSGSLSPRRRVLSARPAGTDGEWTILPLESIDAAMTPAGLDLSIGPGMLRLARPVGDSRNRVDVVEAEGLELRFGFW
ncbi:DUF3179 domain-containing protein, partial [bacterium]|nr:DUF3179 domain-containing protein [bacterium]